MISANVLCRRQIILKENIERYKLDKLESDTTKKKVNKLKCTVIRFIIIIL